MGFDVVTELTEHVLNKNHHVVVDNFFSSPVLSEHLYQNGTYFTGTTRDTRCLDIMIVKLYNTVAIDTKF